MNGKSFEKMTLALYIKRRVDTHLLRVIAEFLTRELYEQRHADINVQVGLKMRDNYM